MYVTTLQIDRFGPCSNLYLDGLADGLNVLFGPAETPKSVLVEFLRAMFAGFDADPHHCDVRPMTRRGGGFVTLQCADGRHTIGRFDDGSREGALTLQRPDGVVSTRRNVAELLGNLTTDLLSRALIIDFDRQPDLQALLLSAADAGFEVFKEERHSERRSVLEREISEGEQHVASLRRETAAVERSLLGLAEKRQELASRLAPRQSWLDSLDGQPNELQQIEVQLRRWRKTLRDLTTVRRLLREPSPGAPTARLKGASETTPSNPSPPTATDPLRQIQNEWSHVYRSWNEWHDCEQSRRAANEQHQLSRCALELRQAITILANRREELLRRAPQKSRGNQADCGVTSLDESHVPSAPHPAAKSPLVSATPEFEEVSQEIARLAEVRLKWIAEMDEWEADLAERRAELARLGDSTTSLFAEAANYLRRLTASAWHRIRLSPERQVELQNSSGSWLAYDRLDPGTRDQLYLAFCLAITSARESSNTSFPLVVNAAFSKYPSQHIRNALELLRDVGHTRQVLCITRHEHVASVARLLNLPIRAIPAAELAPRYPAPEEHENHVAPERVRTREPRHRQPDPAPSFWNGSDTAQESTNPRRPYRHPHMVQATTASPDEVSDLCFHLHEYDSIEKTPSLDVTNAERLRKVGLLRVGDLLRVPPHDVASDLRNTGVTVDMIETWRAQARLVCEVRGLRPYDARILVACGIRDPEQLGKMHPGALRARVKEFASSAEGQAILMSGTEDDLSRVTDWISSAKDNMTGPRHEPDSQEASHEEVVRPERVPPTRRKRKPAPAERGLGARFAETTASEKPAETPPDPQDDVPHVLVRNAGRFGLKETDGVAEIPWIGPGIAKRLRKLGIEMIADLLNASPDALAPRLAMSRVNSETIWQWQRQTELACRIPYLSIHDAQLLNAAGVTTVEQLAAAVPSELWQKVQSCFEGPEMKRLLSNSAAPDLADLTNWVLSARHLRLRSAA